MRIIILIIAFTYCCTFSQAQNYKLGDMVEGGIIFYISENKDTLLTSAMRDQGIGVSWEEAKQRCESIFSIQDGKMYRGWRLPNKREIQIMRRQRDFISEATEKAGGEALQKDIGTYYWCSTEIDANYAWLMPFGFDRITQMSKGSNLFDARAVRTIIVKKN